MSDVAGFVLVAGLVVAVGLSVVWCCGVPFRDGWTPTAIGIAPLVGVAVTGTACVLAAWVGIGVHLYTVAAISGAVVLVASRFRGRGRPWQRRPGAGTRASAFVESGVLLGGAIVATQAVRTYLVTALEQWDGWAIWGAHAKAIYLDGGISGPAFTEPIYTSEHQQYPILFPSLEALVADALGRFDPQLIHLIPALFLVSFGLAAWGLLRTLMPPPIAAGIASLTMATPSLVANLRNNYADGAVAAFAAIGVVLLAIWLMHESSCALALATVLLAAAGLTKSEGVIFTVAAFGSAGLVATLEHRRTRPLLAALALSVVPAVVWVAYAKVALPADDSYDFGALVDPAQLLDRLPRYSASMRAMNDALAVIWEILVPAIGLTLLVAALARRKRLALYSVLWVAISFVGLGTIYVASTAGIAWHLATSADRVVLTIAAGAPLLAAFVAIDAWDNRPTGEARERRYVFLGLGTSSGRRGSRGELPDGRS